MSSRKWVITETTFGPDLRPFDDNFDLRGLSFDECKRIIINGYRYEIEDWENYTEEEFIERYE